MMFAGWAAEARTYLSLCGCRLRPIHAVLLERRVKSATDVRIATSPGDVDDTTGDLRVPDRAAGLLLAAVLPGEVPEDDQDRTAEKKATLDCEAESAGNGHRGS